MLNIKEDILKNAGNQKVDGPHWLPLHFSVSGDQQLFGSSKSFKISSFVFNIRKKLIQVWNDMRVSNDKKKKILWELFI